MAAQPDSTRLTAGSLAILAGLSLVWGLNFPVIKIALAEVPVWWFRVMCVTIGGAGLLLITALAGQRVLPQHNQIGALLVCAVFSIVGWHLFTGYAVSLMPAGRAGIIAYTMPMWAALFGSLLIGERMTVPRLIGQVLGLAGLAVLMGPDLWALERAPLGAILMLCAAMSWAMGTVLFKRTAWATPVAATIGWQLLAGAVPITTGAALLEAPPDLSALEPKTYAALGYVLALPMLFGQWAYYRTVQRLPASVAAMSTLAVPVIGVIASTLLLGEAVKTNDLAALALICAALFAVLVVPALGARRRAFAVQILMKKRRS